MTKEAKSGKKREFVQRELDAPVEKVVDQKLKDPFYRQRGGGQESGGGAEKSSGKGSKEADQRLILICPRRNVRPTTGFLDQKWLLSLCNLQGSCT